MTILRRTGLAILVAVIPAGLAGPAAAQSFPSRPVTVVVPFPPGGGGDFLARTLQPSFAKALGQQVVVDNKPGASGAIGSAGVARAETSGHTIVLGNIGTHAINAAIFKTLAYDPVKDFAPVSHAVNVRYVVVVGAKHKAATFGDLIAMARQNPGKLNYASGGAGQGPHLGAELLKQVAKIDLTHVPYKGGGPMVAALLAGEVDLAVTDIPSVIGQIKSGGLRPLAVTARERAPALPDTPTSAEAGLPGFEMYAWQALFAPAATPPAVVQRLNAAFVEALNTPEVRERIAASGSDVVASTPAELAAFQAREIRKWTDLVNAAGIERQ
jgi:tripartite-type tricarboxylate transporter receptor subunit TctC